MQQEIEENHAMKGVIIFLLPTVHYLYDEIKEDDMDRTCSAHLVA
jgi:hypothetical protein